MIHLVEQQYNAVIALWLHGHLHKNVYKFKYGIHFVGCDAVITSPTGGNAYGIVHAYKSGDLKVQGFGTQASYELPFKKEALKVTLQDKEENEDNDDGEEC